MTDQLFPHGLADDRSEAAAILAGMPLFWRARFEVLARTMGRNRKARRATAALLRRYGSWLRHTAHLRARQAKVKELRAKVRDIRDANRAARGKPPLK